MAERELEKLYYDIVDRQSCDECSRQLGVFRPGLMNESSDKRVMLIFEGPGGGDKEEENQRSGRKYKEVEDALLKVDEAIKQRDMKTIVRESQRGFDHYWVRNVQRKFFTSLFRTLAEKNVIDVEIEEVDSYVERGKYWKDFFITDAALCPGKRRTLKEAVSKCQSYLGRQITIFEGSSPKLIIPFGGYALSSIVNLRGIPRERPKKATITELHGRLFPYDKFFVIPLLHPSRMYMTLRDSYFQYFREGLSALSGSST